MKIGIVGYGSIGKRHADNAAVLGHEVKVFDPKERRDYKLERYIYEECDAIVVATPSPYHEGPLRAAIERGKHVLIEKPISTSIGALPLLLDVAKAKNLVVMMGNNLRFHPCVQQAKEWMAGGEIGDVIWAQFTCATKSVKPLYLSDGVILNTGSHEVDLALHMFGPAKVMMADVICEENSDTIADFLLRHDNGIRSSFHLDFVTPNEIREAWIVGNKDKIGIELRNRNVSLGSRASARPGNYDGDYFAEMETFIKRIEGDVNTPGATGDDGLATLQVLLDVRKMAGLV